MPPLVLGYLLLDYQNLNLFLLKFIFDIIFYFHYFLFIIYVIMESIIISLI